MDLPISRKRLRSLLESPYLVYPAGIVAIVLVYTLLFLLLSDNFHFSVNARPDILTALYWVIISMTTTGYGDIYPTTPVGQLFTMLVVVTGLLILFAVVLPLMVTPIMDRLIRRPRLRASEWISDHVVICGYNAIVETLIDGLAGRGIPFVVIDPSADVVMSLQRHGHDAIQGDPADEDVLNNARIARASYVIANAGDDRNAAITLTASQVSACKIIALVESLDMAQYLEYAGADFVVSPKQILGRNIGLTAASAISFELSNAVDLGDDVKICRLPVYPDNPLVGRKLKDVGIRETTGANVVAVFKNGEFIVNPPAGTVIDEATVLVVMGTEAQLEKLGSSSSIKKPAGDGHCIIAGFGDVGKEVAQRLDEKGIAYTVIDRKPYDVKDQVIGDSADKAALVRAGIGRAAAIVVTLNDDAKNMLTILLARNLNPHVSIIARANVKDSVGKMYRAGADYVTSLSAVGGQMLARIVEKGALADTVQLAEDVLIGRYAVRGSRLEGKTIAESGMRSRTGCTIVGVRKGDRFVASPAPSEALGPDATVIVIGTAPQLEACAAAYGLKKINE